MGETNTLLILISSVLQRVNPNTQMPSATLNLKEVNTLASDHFIKIFGNVVEHYPAAAIGILKNRPFGSIQDISSAVSGYIDSLNPSGKVLIILNYVRVN